ncbi:MAG: very short patch repair endonuclease [Planctomycetia bacterium]|nr:very short patch repair endonuclease [Planctomycetia bacterium]
MTDVLTKEQRHRCMASIKGKNTKPERVIRKILWSEGYRYRVHVKELAGKPDIVFPGRRKIIFIHGCFWHRHLKCLFFQWPQSNRDFWENKIMNTVARDRRICKTLRQSGWSILVVWECETDPEKISKTISKIRNFLDK